MTAADSSGNSYPSAPHHLRNETADLLKGLAILFMVQVHITEQLARTDVYESILGQLSLFIGGPACAPVFMAVMGFFFPGKKRKTIYFIKRGALLFAGGILLNVARSANLLFHIFSGRIVIDPLPYIFGADILTFAGLGLIIFGLLRLVIRDFAPAYLILAFLVAMTSPSMEQFQPGTQPWSYLYAFIGGTAPWSYFPVFPWLGYVLIGAGLRMVLNSRPQWAKVSDHVGILWVLVPALLFLAFWFQYAFEISGNLEGSGGYYHHGILFFVWNFLFGMIWLLLIRHWYKKRSEAGYIRLLCWMGRNVTFIYVVQWILIGNFATVWYRSLNLWQGVLAFFLVMGFSFAVTALWEIYGSRRVRTENRPMIL